MALIICPECGKKISDKALKCPACAYPIYNGISSLKEEHSRATNTKTPKKLVIISSCVILFILVTVIIVLMFSPKSIFLQEDSISLTIGSEYNLEYLVIPKKTISPKVKLVSSDENVVSIKNDKLYAEKEGECQILLNTWNGKTAKCKVEVISLKDNQKNHIDMLSEYIEENADQSGENNVSIKKIYSLENDEIFMLAKSEHGVCLMFQKNNDYGNDLTMVLLSSGDLRSAKISDVSTFMFDGKKMSTTASGNINLKKYRLGDKINITDVTSENTPSDFEVGITDESQKRIDGEVENAIKCFETFLEENTQFGGISDYGFVLED